MCIYAWNISDKYYPDTIWNDGALGFFETWRGRPNKKKKKEQQQQQEESERVRYFPSISAFSLHT